MSSAASLARRSLSERSIRVLVSPTPVTFAERRSVLQVLERYGPVEVFRMTQGYHANFISVTKEATSASQLIAISPITYCLPLRHIDNHVQHIAFESGPHGGGRASAMASKIGQATTEDSNNQDSDEEQQQFTLEIFPAPDYRHKFAMSNSPLSHPWPKDYRTDKPFASSILKQSLPETIQSKGLAHWLMDLAKPDRKAERLLLKKCAPSKMKASDAEISASRAAE